MTRIAHLIDAETSLDALRRLALLRGEGEPVTSIGAPPTAAGRCVGKVRSVHRPFGSAELAGRRIGRLGDADVLCAWSRDAALAAAASGDRPVLRMLDALPGDAPAIQELRAWTLRGVGLLAVTTEHARRRLAAAEACDQRVCVVPPVASVCSRPADVRAEIRVALGFAPGDTLLIAAGEMRLDSGHRHAAWAHAICRYAGADLRLLYPDTGPAAPRVRHFAGETGFAADHRFAEGRFVLPEALAAADVALFFARRQVDASALVSAMAAGVSVVATDASEVRELTDDGRAAVVTPADNPRAQAAGILRLIEEPDATAEMSARARELAGQLYGPQLVRTRLEAALADAVAGSA